MATIPFDNCASKKGGIRGDGWVLPMVAVAAGCRKALVSVRWATFLCFFFFLLNNLE